MKWVTCRLNEWSKYQEIGGLNGWPEIADTRGNGELAWNDKELVDIDCPFSLHSSAVCN